MLSLCKSCMQGEEEDGEEEEDEEEEDEKEKVLGLIYAFIPYHFRPKNK